jgi:glycosyltransferase involved in cell wall biosynthesis
MKNNISNPPLVSVIMTVFNTETYLSEAVNSILNQSFKDFEFIIIDDGSTDGSATLLDSLSDPRIQLLKSAENLGLIAQSNKALQLARGKYIARMDSDDISLPDRLQTQVAFLEKHKHVGLCGTYLMYFDEERSYTKSILPKTHDAIGAFYLFGNSVVHATIMFRKSILDEFQIRYPTDVRAGGDIAFLSSLYEYTRFTNIPRVFFRCRIRKSSVSRTHNHVQANIGFQVKLKFINKFLVDCSDVEKNELGQKHLSIISEEIKSKQDLKRLMEWIEFLAKKSKLNGVFQIDDYYSGAGHFVYRQLVRNQACNFGNLFFIMSNHSRIVWTWPALYKAIFVLRASANLFRNR